MALACQLPLSHCIAPIPPSAQSSPPPPATVTYPPSPCSHVPKLASHPPSPCPHSQRLLHILRPHASTATPPTMSPSLLPILLPHHHPLPSISLPYGGISQSLPISGAELHVVGTTRPHTPSPLAAQTAVSKCPSTHLPHPSSFLNAAAPPPKACVRIVCHVPCTHDGPTPSQPAPPTNS